MTDDVRRAFLAVGRDDVLPAEQRQVGAVGPIRLDVVGHRQAELHAQLIVVIAVAGGGMHKARARIVGDMIAGEHGDVIVPLAVAALDAAEGVGESQRLQCQLIGQPSHNSRTSFDLA